MVEYLKDDETLANFDCPELDALLDCEPTESVLWDTPSIEDNPVKLKPCAISPAPVEEREVLLLAAMYPSGARPLNVAAQLALTQLRSKQTIIDEGWADFAACATSRCKASRKLMIMKVAVKVPKRHTSYKELNEHTYSSPTAVNSSNVQKSCKSNVRGSDKIPKTVSNTLNSTREVHVKQSVLKNRSRNGSGTNCVPSITTPDDNPLRAVESTTADRHFSSGFIKRQKILAHEDTRSRSVLIKNRIPAQVVRKKLFIKRRLLNVPAHSDFFSVAMKSETKFFLLLLTDHIDRILIVIPGDNLYKWTVDADELRQVPYTPSPIKAFGIFRPVEFEGHICIGPYNNNLDIRTICAFKDSLNVPMYPTAVMLSAPSTTPFLNSIKGIVMHVMNEDSSITGMILSSDVKNQYFLEVQYSQIIQGPIKIPEPKKTSWPRSWPMITPVRRRFPTIKITKELKVLRRLRAECEVSKRHDIRSELVNIEHSYAIPCAESVDHDHEIPLKERLPTEDYEEITVPETQELAEQSNSILIKKPVSPFTVLSENYEIQPSEKIILKEGVSGEKFEKTNSEIIANIPESPCPPRIRKNRVKYTPTRAELMDTLTINNFDVIKC